MKAYTDHKNLTYKSYNTERVIRWQLIEFSSELIFIKGTKNIVADALSRRNKIDNADNNKVELALNNCLKKKENVFTIQISKLL